MTSRLRVRILGLNSQMAELFTAGIKTKLLILVDRSGIEMLWMCRKASEQRILLHGCTLATAQWVVLDFVFFVFLISFFFLPLTPIAWRPCQGATASNQIIYHSSGEVFPKTAINYLRALAPNGPIVFPADVVTWRGDSPHASLPLSARASPPSASICVPE